MHCINHHSDNHADHVMIHAQHRKHPRFVSWNISAEENRTNDSSFFTDKHIILRSLLWYVNITEHFTGLHLCQSHDDLPVMWPTSALSTIRSGCYVDDMSAHHGQVLRVGRYLISSAIPLTHWGRVTHICLGNLTNIGSDNGLSPDRRHAIIWTNAPILLIGP